MYWLADRRKLWCNVSGGARGQALDMLAWKINIIIKLVYHGIYIKIICMFYLLPTKTLVYDINQNKISIKLEPR